ncbi:hypothetical protein SHKM778_39170 [Streptomyces sp. KM77-8]|uniref:Uncharacterized protein n=1 Tax=Streptomyces haneummycinicus TaxID=3074435 RepID=A0AAT9HJD6_9ACTN
MLGTRYFLDLRGAPIHLVMAHLGGDRVPHDVHTGGAARLGRDTGRRPGQAFTCPGVVRAAPAAGGEQQQDPGGREKATREHGGGNATHDSASCLGTGNALTMVRTNMTG